ncbi:MAG: bifunctional proline dehydrogenase/L-glutamate gamma-semialdehyde dehydrogenase PutA [Burkholderiales bacterium]|nr:bifunctional proline dehydrogenase/L-glutamate gamma-semialdehyde dehydrogenase PutA [Burkholderiales bacterium]
MFNLCLQEQSELRNKITQNYRRDEAECIQNLLQILNWDESKEQKVTKLATDLIQQVRDNRMKGKGVDALMQEFKLSTAEGVALMCLAESLLRIPDTYTQNKLIRDKIKTGDWKSHTKSGNFFVNASSWGLVLTGKMVNDETEDSLTNNILNVVGKFGEPVIRRSMETAVRVMGNQFVMGETIHKALQASIAPEKQGYQFSYDMLGEAALTDEDAERYMESYINAIHSVGRANAERGPKNGPGISVKLSAIHPRYARSQQERTMNELYARLHHLVMLAKEYGIALFIDAEETDRLELSLDLLSKLLSDPAIQGYEGLGFVIQAYQRRCPYVIDYIVDLAKRNNTRLMVRLVKGAYWDTEIKKAQVDGQLDYPVYTRKFHTDLSYLACAKKLLAAQEYIYPAFATHNAYSLAAIYTMATDENKEFEFQCLYGMGETLYNNVVGAKNLGSLCRVYAPVGSYETLLAYLVRRLLENGANSSFVHQLVDPTIPISELVENPVHLVKKTGGVPNPFFNKPTNIYPAGRINSKGLDLSDEIQLHTLDRELNKYFVKEYKAEPLLAGHKISERNEKIVLNPANQKDKVGVVRKAVIEEVDIAVKNSVEAFPEWSQTSPASRAEKIRKFADLMEENYYEILNIVVREAGKTLSNGIAEVREAVDFCRYYALQVESEFSNETHKALGPVVAISPWNFPLAIFVGEVVSSLAAGNTVIAKPSDQTNLIAFYAVKLMHEAGIPEGAIQLMPGSGSIVGNALTKHSDVKAVIFTGSTEVAQTINQNIAAKAEAGVLIAETGGQNAMIVDSTALPEQVVLDVVSSGFDSAGQRCSALRVLYLQADIADKTIAMLKGAMDELYVGNPLNLNTDVGPVIDTKAQKVLIDHIENMRKSARMCYQAKLQPECENGIFVAPTIFEIGSMKELKREVFGPVIHIIRFDGYELDKVIKDINSSGYGLTQGLHSRLEETASKVYNNIKAGNIYINRNTVGAVVGVQPFGGEGLSGTGPKAGGPLYLYRLVNTEAAPKYQANKKSVDFSSLTKFVASLGQYGIKQANVTKLIHLAHQLKQHSPIAEQVELPGPTGERNFMMFAPRGNIACLANDIASYAEQIIYALATGNNIILLENEITTKLAANLPKATELVSKLNDAELIHAVLVSSDYPNIAELRTELAARDSLLTHVLVQTEFGYDSHLLVTERTVSINITATGGNVQLMSIDDRV